MRVIVAVHHFPPCCTGGAEWLAYRTAVELRERDHGVHVVCVGAIDSGDGNGLTFRDDIYDSLTVHRMSVNLEAASDSFRWDYDNPYLGDTK